MTQSIEVDHELPHPPEKVWRALTEPTLLASWLMENDIQPIVGHRFQFRAKPMGGWDGIVHCEVLDADAPRLLRYRWQGGKDEGKGPGSHLDTIVTWTLTPKGTGTHLHLHHAGFLDKDTFAHENMDKGWRGPLAERLAAALSA
ncbi:MAG: SRPBCC domain-containing protein [Polyangia bacterium]